MMEATARCKHCSKVVPLERMEEHQMFFCSLKQMRCQHIKANGEMCGFVCSGADALRDHCRVCKDHPRKRRSVSRREGGTPRSTPGRGMAICEDCQQVFPDRAGLTEHQRVCPLKNVPCPLHCGLWMQRTKVPDHILCTAVSHKPLRRPSVTDYGSDNIHMVIAVLMEALQNAKKAQQEQKTLLEEMMSNLDPSASLNHISSRHSNASGEGAPEAAIGFPKSQISASSVVGSAELNGLPTNIATFAVAAFSDSREAQEKTEIIDGAVCKNGEAQKPPESPQREVAVYDQDTAPPMNGVKIMKSAEAAVTPLPSSPSGHHAMRIRKRRPLNAAEVQKHLFAPGMTAPPPQVRTSLRASAPNGAGLPPKASPGEPAVSAPARIVRVNSLPHLIRVRPAYGRAIVNPHALSQRNAAELSTPSHPLQSPTAATNVNIADTAS